MNILGVNQSSLFFFSFTSMECDAMTMIKIFPFLFYCHFNEFEMKIRFRLLIFEIHLRFYGQQFFSIFYHSSDEMKKERERDKKSASSHSWSRWNKYEAIIITIVCFYTLLMYKILWCIYEQQKKCIFAWANCDC